MCVAVCLQDKIVPEIGQFQLFGFDLMVDHQLDVHLIEINRNPDLSVHTSVLREVIPPVLKEIIGMVTEVHAKQVGGGVKKVFPLSANTAAKVLIPEPS